MGQPPLQSPQDILRLLASGDFSKLTGIAEDLQLEAKAAPYFHPGKQPSEKQRYELAKAVNDRLGIEPPAEVGS